MLVNYQNENINIWVCICIWIISMILIRLAKNMSHQSWEKSYLPLTFHPLRSPFDAAASGLVTSQRSPTAGGEVGMMQFIHWNYVRTIVYYILSLDHQLIGNDYFGHSYCYDNHFQHRPSASNMFSLITTQVTVWGCLYPLNNYESSECHQPNGLSIAVALCQNQGTIVSTSNN